MSPLDPGAMGFEWLGGRLRARRGRNGRTAATAKLEFRQGATTEAAQYERTVSASLTWRSCCSAACLSPTWAPPSDNVAGSTPVSATSS
jgi:hypothetical protein